MRDEHGYPGAAEEEAQTQAGPADVGSRSGENTKDRVRTDKEGEVKHVVAQCNWV